MDSHKQPWIIGILDVILINVSFVLAYIIRYEIEFPYRLEFDAPFSAYIPFALLMTVLSLLTFAVDGIYEVKRRRPWFDEVYRVVSGTMTSIVLVMAVTFFIQPEYYSRGMLIIAGVLIVLQLGLVRIIKHIIDRRRRRHGIGVQRVLVVGAGDLGRSVIQTIMGDPDVIYQLVGFVDDDPATGTSSLGRIPGLGTLDDLDDIIQQHHIDELIVTLPWMHHRRIMQLADDYDQSHLNVRVVPDIFQQRMQQLDIDSLNGIPLININGDGRLPRRSSFLLKRVVDIMLTGLSLPFTLALFGIIALLIKLDSPGPVFFKQRRVGKDGREFYVYKFRTMIVGADDMKHQLAQMNEADGPIFKIRNDPRLTRVGKWLRRTSLDEIPQIINVVRGEMSWVGPRPGTPDEVAQYEPWQRKRISVLPGITGLWQVSGRSNIPFAEMCLLDIFYIENWSLDLEIRIIMRTVPSVLLGRGAY